MSKISSSFLQYVFRALELKHGIPSVASVAVLIWLYAPIIGICVNEMCVQGYVCGGGCAHSLIAYIIMFGGWPYASISDASFWLINFALLLIGVLVYGVWLVIRHYTAPRMQGKKAC